MTMEETDISTQDRLIQVLKHLGVERAHFAACALPDYAGLMRAHPEAIASFTLVNPFGGIDTDALVGLACPLLVIAGDQGAAAENARKAIGRVPEATLVSLSDYSSAAWADVIADRADEVGAAIARLLASTPLPPLSQMEGEGEVAGISYRIEGSGPPLVLIPLMLARSQWEPLLPFLSERFCTIKLGGPWLGGVGWLEERAKYTSYLRMIGGAIDEAHLGPGQTVLDVGCGSGAVDRWLARRTTGANPIVAVDVNPYLLREAAALARREGVERVIHFRDGNAELLPFPENSFDVSMSITVLEEVDTDRALREMVRVTKPGGRVLVIVRAVDRPWWVNLPLPVELMAKVERRIGSIEEGACADASLYRRFHDAGLSDVVLYPQWAVYSPSGQRRVIGQANLVALLSTDELQAWEAAAGRAEAEGTFFWAQPFHCAVGTKP